MVVVLQHFGGDEGGAPDEHRQKGRRNPQGEVVPQGASCEGGQMRHDRFVAVKTGKHIHRVVSTVDDWAKKGEKAGAWVSRAKIHSGGKEHKEHIAENHPRIQAP